MIKKLFLLSIYFLYTINLAYSQTKPDDPTVSETRQGKFTVSGIVTDSETNEPLIGASVYIKSSHYGGFTGNDGRYKLALQAGNYTLVASYIGYKTVETPIQINVDTNINFNLKLSENEIEEVKITKQRNFWRNLNVGRNISSLNAKRIEHLNTNNAADILQATMPGVWSTQTSGAPGDHQNVKIRGINSIFGCTDPLYIIDGVAVPIVNLHSLGIADLNVHDIENITVLKDASSTAVYGFQGGNGVIIIDTKRSDNNAINFSYKLGVQQLPKQLSLLDSKGFLTNIDSAYNNGVNQIYKYYPTYTDTVKNTNWQDALFQYGVLNEYQLAGSGKIGKTYFYISGNFYSHEGIVEKTGFKRYTAAANIGRNVNERFSIEVGIRSSFQENNNNLDVYNGNDVIIESINKSPLLKSTPDSFYYWPRNDMKPYNLVLRNYYKYPLISDYPESKIFTDSVLKSNLNTLNTKTNSFDLRAKYKIADNLYVNASSSISSRTNNYISDIRIGVNENYFKTNENYLLFNQQFNINYNKTFTDHNLQLTCGYRNYADNAYWGLDSISDINNTHNSFLKNSLAINGKHGAVIRYINSWSVIANYDFKNKYYLSFIANKESLKVDNDKTLQSVFPSLTVSWDIARERFMEHLPFINEFKLFSNWGKVGNMPINVLAKDVYSNYRYNYFDTIIYSRGISQFSNHNLKPEIIEEYNTGINLACFNNNRPLVLPYY